MFRTFTPTDLQSLFDAFALLETGISICLLPPDNTDHSSLNRQSSGVPPSQLGTHRSPPATSSSPFLGLYSSGSTGTPKLSWRPWENLKSEIRLSSATTSLNWASPFSPSSFAGVQVALQAWAAKGAVHSLDTRCNDAFRFLAARNVHALSCTPTFLDLTLQQSVPIWRPLQITLGGEPLRSAAGERFRTAFPQARFTVIYASAEFGILLKTHRLDGWYELASLQKRFPRWRIQAGELQLWHHDAWRSTGDLVELDGELIQVVGRADAVVNIAGGKVSLAEVSRVAEEVPGVRAAVAFAEPSSVCGQIVALRFTPDDGVSHRDLQNRLETHLRERLRKEAWPRHWEIGPIELGPNSKRSSKTVPPKSERI